VIDGLQSVMTQVTENGMLSWPKTRRGPRLVQDARADVGASLTRVEQALERDATLQPGVGAEKYLAHAAAAELADDLIGADPGADLQAVARLERPDHGDRMTAHVCSVGGVVGLAPRSDRILSRRTASLQCWRT
jgi:hypothetical protein